MSEASRRTSRAISHSVGMSVLLGALCLPQPGCTSKPSKTPDPGGERSPEALATALDKSCLQSDLATLVRLLHPAERADVVGSSLAASSMQCALLSSMADELPSGSDSKVSIDITGLSSLRAACKSMAQVAARYGTHFERWQATMTAESEAEQKARWDKARKSLDGVDVPALMRELQAAQLKAKAPMKLDYPGFGHGVESSALEVAGDAARVPIREATGYYALVRVGPRWFVSLERSEPGETSEQVAARAREQATAADQATLRDAARGTWESAWGRLSFRADGTATFETRAHCASEAQHPWLTRPGSCKPLKVEGKVELAPFEIGLDDDGFTNISNAYVDTAGRLHIATSQADVGKLDGARHGQVKLNMFRTLHVQGDSCRLEDSMQETNEPVGCAFLKEGGVDVLRVDWAPAGESAPSWLVYVPEQGLLVPPALYATSFARVAGTPE